MYRNKKFKKNVPTTTGSTERSNKRTALNTIDENASVKITRTEHQAANETSTNKKGRKSTNNEDGTLEEMFSSEENVPASQEPTQRYLSQRSNLAMTLTRTQSRNASTRPPNNYFELVLIKAGVQLDEGENFVLSCDHVAIVSKFREIFVKSQNYPDNVDTFKLGLREALAPKSKLIQKLLSGCTISTPGEQSVYQSLDSMIVNFLMIDFLRDHVVEILLDKIDEAACNTSTHFSNTSIPLLPLLLAQLRYVTLSHGELIYKRICEIFEKAKEAAKWDIIANAELILDSSKHDQFVEMLLNNMSESKELFHNIIIQTLINLSLSARMQGKLRCKILAYIKEDQCPTALMPALIKFLLKILNEDNDDSIIELINTLREILIWRTNSATAANEKQSQVELFNFIEQGLIRSKKFYYIWQKMIASLPASKFRAIDFLILLLLIHIKDDNSLYIENILRRRIKLEHINVNILNECKQKYSTILELHTNILMQILHDFLRERHKSVADFARASYGILFQICDSVQKNILKKLLELTCDRSAQNMTNLALELIRDLQRKYPKDVQNWGMLLMPLLDRLHEMTLSQTRLVMEILCSIAYPKTSLSGCATLQDQIDMLVKKQLINRTTLVKKQGIIGSVQLIDSIARIEETTIEVDELNTTFFTVSDLPDGRGKIAANYIVRTNSATMYCPESMALFYDELASACAASPADRTNSGYLDKSFLIWLCELMTYYFQNSFVAEQSIETTGCIKLSNQKCINTLEDAEDEESELLTIAVNISGLVLNPKNDAASSIFVLAPLFNLVRVLHLQRYKGSLEQINALLGCAIVLPTFFDDPNTDAIFYDYDEDLQKKILDIYYHYVNWLREVVSSFATQREAMIRSKVLKRLTDLIGIEEKIRTLLIKAPIDYMPPISQFITQITNSPIAKTATGARGRTANTTTNQKSNRSKNKSLQLENEAVSINETHANTTHIPDITMKLAAAGKAKNSTGSGKTNFEILYGPKEVYRQMDSAIILVLHETLNIKFPLPEAEIGKQIGLLEFRFILTDIVSKLESVTGIQKFQTEQNLQYIAKPHYFLSDLAKFLTIIVENMNKISVAIIEILDNVKHAYGHVDLFTVEFSYLKVCFGLCLRLLAAYFSWSELTDTTRNELLKESFLALLKPFNVPQIQSKTTAALAAEMFARYIKYETSIVDLQTAVHLYHLLATLKKFSALKNDISVDNDITLNQTKDLRKLCNTLLSRKWFNYDGTMEKGSTCNVYLDELVKGFLKDSDFKRQQSIIRIINEECKLLTGKDGSLKSFPNFKKANFPLLFRDLCEILISSLNCIIATNNTSSSFSDKLEVWEKSCELLNLLLDIVQEVNLPRNFQAFLKYSHMYLKLVLQHGLQVYEQYMRQNPERISELLKDLQITTRFLHNLCCHSKALKNTAIVSQIPFLRETIENLVFRVKALLAANKCASVFCMANLRNKDLHGDEIISQSDSLTPIEPASDEEIPEDDVSVDETILDTSSTHTGGNRATRSTTENRSKSSSRSKCF